MNASERAELRDLIDRSQIHQVMVRYCRAIDRGDVDLLASVFHEDAINDTGGGYQPASNLGSSVGQSTLNAMVHFIGNEYVEIEDDLAFSETYFLSFSTVDLTGGKTATRTRSGRYLDRLERRNGTDWRIAVRTVVDEWSRVDEVTDGAVKSGNAGVRSRDDLVYQLKTLGVPLT